MGSHTPPTMRIFPCVFLAVSASALPQPQLEALRNTLTSEFGGGDHDDYEQVPYEVLGQYDGYEKRKYSAVKWACTEDTYRMEDEEESALASAGRRKKRPGKNMFPKLFGYISGANKEEESIDMTVPVLSSMKLAENNMLTKEMCFYLDSAHQANPPKPNDPKVKIEANEEFIVYVHTFGGYAMRDNVNVREAKKFLEVLNEAGVEVDTSMFYTAGYDSPMKFWDRRNEVMYLAANQV